MQLEQFAQQTYSFDAPGCIEALQIHDAAQAARFFSGAVRAPEVAFMRFEVASLPGGRQEICVDVTFFDIARDEVFVVIAALIGDDGCVHFPSRFAGVADPVFRAVAARIREELLARQPQQYELRPVTSQALPFSLDELTDERMLPGARDYGTLIHHLKRYMFVRTHLLPGRVLDCASGAGYGASMMMQRGDVESYVGVDLSAFAVGFAAKLVKDERVAFRCMPLAELEEGLFENVVSLETIEHTTDPHAFLMDLTAKLHPDGQLILSLPMEKWGGSHLNSFHFTNWTHARFERLVSSFFGEWHICKQRLSLLGPDTFGASEIFDRPAQPDEDECLVALLRKPRHRPPRRTVIRRREAIGDVIWTTPVVHAAREAHPDHHVVMVTDKTEVFIGNPHVDMVATLAFTPRNDDLLIDLDLAYEERRTKHILAAYSDKAALPVAGSRPCLYPSDAEARSVGDAISNLADKNGGLEFWVAIHAAAKSPHRIWPQAHWKVLLDQLSEDKRIGLIWVGGPEDYSPAQLDLPSAILERSLDLVGKTNLAMTAAAISFADLLVAPDSGMSHVAAAVGTRAIVLFGMADPATRVALDGSTFPIWADIECRGCLATLAPHHPPLCRYGHADCMERIKPPEVLAACRQILENTVPGMWRTKLDRVRPRAQAPLPSIVGPGRRIRLGVLSIDVPGLACHTLRVADPFALLARYIEPIYLMDQHGDGTQLQSEIDGCDFFFVQRAYPGPDTADVLEKIFKTGKPIVYETDDLLDNVPSDHPQYATFLPRIEKMLEVIRRASLVITTTESLRDHYSRYNHNTRVFANHICQQRWETIPSTVKGNDVVTIGFAGTGTHLADIAMIEGALLRIAQRYGERVKFVFWGAVTNDLRNLPNATIIQVGVPYIQYPSRLARLEFDIGLVPLRDTPFNRCKSDLKWIEYSSLGVASVVSALPQFSSASTMGLAVVVPNDEDAWYVAISRLIDDSSLRRALGAAAREYVFRERALENRIGAYAELLNEILPAQLHLPDANALVRADLLPFSEDDSYVNLAAYRRWLASRGMREVDAEVYAELLMRQQPVPTVGILCVTPETVLEQLASTLDSLANLLHSNWQLIVISDVAAPDDAFVNSPQLGWLQLDDLSDPILVCDAVNRLMREVEMNYACILPPGAQLAPEATVLVANYFQTHPEWVALYTDHDHLDQFGRQLRPAFKPDLSIDFLRSADYVDAAVFFRPNAALEVGGVQPYPYHESYELVLRLLEQFGSPAVGHVAELLVSLPLQKIDSSLSEASLRVAVENHLERSGIKAEVGSGLVAQTLRVVYRHERQPLVTVVIPTRNRVDLMRPCLESLFHVTAYPHFEVIVVDNQSDDPDLFDLYAQYRALVGEERFRVVHYDAPFNFSAQVNLAAQHGSGDVLLLLNNDCEVLDPQWMDRLVHHALRPDVGAVGAMLLAPETGQVRHAGIVLGMPGGLMSVADHVFRDAMPTDEGYLKRLQTDQEYSAVTAACLMVRREVFWEVGGFDAERLAVLYNDVDFCLRLRAKGYRNVYTPYSRVLHRTGASLNEATHDPALVLNKFVRERDEAETMFERWLPALARDPYGSRHWALNSLAPTVDLHAPLHWNPDFHHRPRVIGFPLPGGSGEYRVRMPLEGLSQAGRAHGSLLPPKNGAFPSISVVELARKAPDSLLLHSTVNSVMESNISKWRKHFSGTRFVFGLDDRLGEIPRKSSVYLSHQRHQPDARYRMRRILSHCDRAVVSTRPLAEMLTGMIDDVRVIPNALERHTWEVLKPQRGRGQKPRVGWVGAQQHRGDLELVLEVVAATHQHIDWVFMGMWLPEFAPFVKEKHGFVPFFAYPKKMASLDLDLAIAPLEINSFNEAKSNLRLLEYGALGYPVVCTDIYPYREGSPPVTRLPNEPSLWIDAVLQKVADPECLAREGDALREWVSANFWLEHHLPAWQKALFE